MKLTNEPAEENIDKKKISLMLKLYIMPETHVCSYYFEKFLMNVFLKKSIHLELIYFILSIFFFKVCFFFQGIRVFF